MSIIPIKSVQLWWKPLRFPYTFESLAEGTAFLQQKAKNVWPGTLQECRFCITWGDEEPVEGVLTIDPDDSENPLLLENAVQALLENDALMFSSAKEQPISYERAVATVGWQMESITATKSPRALRLLASGEGLQHGKFHQNFKELQNGIQKAFHNYPLLRGVANLLRPSYHAVQEMPNRTAPFRKLLLSLLTGHLAGVFSSALSNDNETYQIYLSSYQRTAKEILSESHIQDERRTKRGQQFYRLGKEDVRLLSRAQDHPFSEEAAADFLHRDEQILGLFHYPAPKDMDRPDMLFQTLYASLFYETGQKALSRCKTTRNVVQMLRETYHFPDAKIRDLVQCYDPLGGCVTNYPNYALRH